MYGGWVDDDESNVIGRLNPATMTWTKAGSLNNARRGHGAIFNGDVVIVAGGFEDKKTEACTIVDDGSVTCIEQDPNLYDYCIYPEMFLVDDEFCKLF